MNTPNDKQDGEREMDPVAERARELFDDSVERLDAATLSKLNQGRQAALEELASGRRRGRWVRWAPATGMAAAAAVAIVLLRGPAPVDDIVTPAFDDFEILISSDNLDMIEDLEFYLWIDEERMGDADVG